MILVYTVVLLCVLCIIPYLGTVLCSVFVVFVFMYAIWGPQRHSAINPADVKLRVRGQPTQRAHTITTIVDLGGFIPCGSLANHPCPPLPLTI